MAKKLQFNITLPVFRKMFDMLAHISLQYVQSDTECEYHVFKSTQKKTYIISNKKHIIFKSRTTAIYLIISHPHRTRQRLIIDTIRLVE